MEPNKSGNEPLVNVNKFAWVFLFESGDRDRPYTFRVPLVDEYVSEQQNLENEVFTIGDLESEIETAFSLGSDGYLTLPIITPDNKQIRTAWLNLCKFTAVTVEKIEVFDRDKPLLNGSERNG